VAAALIKWIKKGLDCAMRFVWSEGVTAIVMCGRRTVQYGDSCMNQREVYGLLERFRGGLTSVVDDMRSAQP